MFLLGLAVGTAQFVLLSRITSAILLKKGRMLLYIALKVALYLAFFALLALFFRPYAIPAIVGYGVGITAGAFINFILRR